MDALAVRNARRREIGFERRERTRRRLLAAAARVVAESGEAKASINDFIEAAGVSRGTFYNYYATREELLEDLWALMGRSPLHKILAAIRLMEDPAERFAAGARMVLAASVEDPTWGWLIYALSGDSTGMSEDILSYPVENVRLGFDSGRFHAEDMAAVIDLCIGAVRSAMKALLSEPRPPAYIEALTSMLLRVVGLDSDEALEVANLPLPRI